MNLLQHPRVNILNIPCETKLFPAFNLTLIPRLLKSNYSDSLLFCIVESWSSVSYYISSELFTFS